MLVEEVALTQPLFDGESFRCLQMWTDATRFHFSSSAEREEDEPHITVALLLQQQKHDAGDIDGNREGRSSHPLTLVVATLAVNPTQSPRVVNHLVHPMTDAPETTTYFGFFGHQGRTFFLANGAAPNVWLAFQCGDSGKAQWACEATSVRLFEDSQLLASLATRFVELRVLHASQHGDSVRCIILCRIRRDSSTKNDDPKSDVDQRRPHLCVAHIDCSSKELTLISRSEPKPITPTSTMLDTAALASLGFWTTLPGPSGVGVVAVLRCGDQDSPSSTGGEKSLTNAWKASGKVTAASPSYFNCNNEESRCVWVLEPSLNGRNHARVVPYTLHPLSSSSTATAGTIVMISVKHDDDDGVRIDVHALAPASHAEAMPADSQYLSTHFTPPQLALHDGPWSFSAGVVPIVNARCGNPTSLLVGSPVSSKALKYSHPHTHQLIAALHAPTTQLAADDDDDDEAVNAFGRHCERWDAVTTEKEAYQLFSQLWDELHASSSSSGVSPRACCTFLVDTMSQLSAVGFDGMVAAVAAALLGNHCYAAASARNQLSPQDLMVELVGERVRPRLIYCVRDDVRDHVSDNINHDDIAHDDDVVGTNRDIIGLFQCCLVWLSLEQTQRCEHDDTEEPSLFGDFVREASHFTSLGSAAPKRIEGSVQGLAVILTAAGWLFQHSLNGLLYPTEVFQLLFHPHHSWLVNAYKVGASNPLVAVGAILCSSEMGVPIETLISSDERVHMLQFLSWHQVNHTFPFCTIKALDRLRMLSALAVDGCTSLSAALQLLVDVCESCGGYCHKAAERLLQWCDDHQPSSFTAATMSKAFPSALLSIFQLDPAQLEQRFQKLQGTPASSVPVLICSALLNEFCVDRDLDTRSEHTSRFAKRLLTAIIEGSGEDGLRTAGAVLHAFADEGEEHSSHSINVAMSTFMDIPLIGDIRCSHVSARMFLDVVQLMPTQEFEILADIGDALFAGEVTSKTVHMSLAKLWHVSIATNALLVTHGSSPFVLDCFASALGAALLSDHSDSIALLQQLDGIRQGQLMWLRNLVLNAPSPHAFLQLERGACDFVRELTGVLVDSSEALLRALGIRRHPALSAQNGDDSGEELSDDEDHYCEGVGIDALNIPQLLEQIHQSFVEPLVDALTSRLSHNIEFEALDSPVAGALSAVSSTVSLLHLSTVPSVRYAFASRSGRHGEALGALSHILKSMHKFTTPQHVERYRWLGEQLMKNVMNGSRDSKSSTAESLLPLVTQLYPASSVASSLMDQRLQRQYVDIFSSKARASPHSATSRVTDRLPHGLGTMILSELRQPLHDDSVDTEADHGRASQLDHRADVPTPPSTTRNQIEQISRNVQQERVALAAQEREERSIVEATQWDAHRNQLWSAYASILVPCVLLWKHASHTLTPLVATFYETTHVECQQLFLALHISFCNVQMQPITNLRRSEMLNIDRALVSCTSEEEAYRSAFVQHVHSALTTHHDAASKWLHALSTQIALRAAIVDDETFQRGTIKDRSTSDQSILETRQLRLQQKHTLEQKRFVSNANRQFMADVVEDWASFAIMILHSASLELLARSQMLYDSHLQVLRAQALYYHTDSAPSASAANTSHGWDDDGDISISMDELLPHHNSVAPPPAAQDQSNSGWESDDLFEDDFFPDFHSQLDNIPTAADPITEALNSHADAESLEAERLRAEAEAAREAERLEAEAEAARQADLREAERLRAEAEAAREAERLEAEAEAARQADLREAERLRAEAEAARKAERLEAEAEAARQADLREAERLRAEADAEAKRLCAEAEFKDASQVLDCSVAASVDRMNTTGWDDDDELFDEPEASSPIPKSSASDVVAPTLPTTEQLNASGWDDNDDLDFEDQFFSNPPPQPAEAFLDRNAPALSSTAAQGLIRSDGELRESLEDEELVQRAKIRRLFDVAFVRIKR
ncbi:kinetoplast-associated protein, putative [Bodo saltans]|uniref:Kinetoplast-associated protein, putative n=1 Tax=Bodo saltans TaxID=75058 RepID=A0A0S4JKG2_BODSA|nr:kinetoplast-associated protein, putative [Bodo saltans]|eukprot:CUG90646.1 kinetoplast-associated protein, putative [Bodo saltans]